jgi:hypothetical protein
MTLAVAAHRSLDNRRRAPRHLQPANILAEVRGQIHGVSFAFPDDLVGVAERARDLLPIRRSPRTPPTGTTHTGSVPAARWSSILRPADHNQYKTAALLAPKPPARDGRTYRRACGNGRRRRTCRGRKPGGPLSVATGPRPLTKPSSSRESPPAAVASTCSSAPPYRRTAVPPCRRRRSNRCRDSRSARRDAVAQLAAFWANIAIATAGLYTDRDTAPGSAPRWPVSRPNSMGGRGRAGVRVERAANPRRGQRHQRLGLAEPC